MKVEPVCVRVCVFGVGSKARQGKALDGVALATTAGTAEAAAAAEAATATATTRVDDFH